MKSIHFVGEWFDCRVPTHALAEPQTIQARCLEQIACRHLPVSYQHFTRTAAGGVIGTMVGKDIHLVVRSFPADNAVIADLHVQRMEVSEISAAMRVFDGLRDAFRPMRALLHRVPPQGQRPCTQGRAPRAPTEVWMAKASVRAS